MHFYIMTIEPAVIDYHRLFHVEPAVTVGITACSYYDPTAIGYTVGRNTNWQWQ